MSDRIIKPLAVFILVIVVILAGTAVIGLLSGTSGTPDGQRIDGQSPSQFQPSNLNQGIDPESGSLSIESGTSTVGGSTSSSGGSILVDLRHSNTVTQAELEPIESAMFSAGHSFEYDTGQDPLNETLDGHDGYLIIQPTEGFSESEREAVNEFTASGGRVVILGEPTQPRVASSGLFGTSTAIVSFGADKLLDEYGISIGPELLYNTADESNDNGFKSIYTSPVRGNQLTEGVETVSFDRGGYAVTREDSRATTVFTAVDDTKTLETRRTGTYPTVVRNDDMVFVADSTFIQPIELYDTDNEVFVSNLMQFLLGGEDPRNAGGSTASETQSTQNESTTQN
ncbi:MAG: RNase PH-related exoribonuclease [Haloquadratum walsbyi J07HQW1]|uniref:RNase PH-related exoribonuclease n=1 Tax=Haloquadratum walsbyi J07HQW1 TaxID=1238424 RepID=U1N7N2_9EURY|nr:MAG: RNase PH-related exoribonuclease [Haloquadratum walsbyi J07HQW1]